MNLIKITHNSREHYYNLDLLVSFEFSKTGFAVGPKAQIKRILEPETPDEAEIRLHFQGAPVVTLSGPEAARIFSQLSTPPSPVKRRNRPSAS